jgi:hypothetical protein
VNASGIIDSVDGFWGEKPKGMHRKTYERKVAELDYATQMGMSCFVSKYAQELMEIWQPK